MLALSDGCVVHRGLPVAFLLLFCRHNAVESVNHDMGPVPATPWHATPPPPPLL